MLSPFRATVLVLTVAIAPLVAAPATAPELAAALQKKYDGVKDFSADFVHAYEGGVLRKQITERGTLQVKKPGKMRWEYTAPEEKVFVSDGVKMYSYIKQDKQVIVSNVPAADQATTPALFLAGKGSLTRDFTPSLVDPPAGSPAGSQGLKLRLWPSRAGGGKERCALRQRLKSPLGRRHKDRRKLGCPLEGLPITPGERAPALGEEDDVGAAGAMGQQVLDPANQRLDIVDLLDFDHPFEPVRVAVGPHRIGRRQPGQKAAECGGAARLGAHVCARQTDPACREWVPLRIGGHGA